ncbi:cyclin-dependent kinase 4 inhibitor B-like [Eleutherodactylus coqui]|uniref:cyclin-dependent kinase 4 inhibitor B-like n=1 Tax=Eleutherodactylus coqui TaxID=57060 RepID=UPI003461ED82
MSEMDRILSVMAAALEVDALSDAVARGDLERVRGLLEDGADPNAANSSKRTAIQVMMMDDARMAQLLLDYSANPNVPDPDSGRFPAHDAAQQGFLDTLIVLLNGKAHIHIPDRTGRLPLDLAPDHIVAALQSLGIVSDSEKHIMQETMEPMIRLH